MTKYRFLLVFLATTVFFKTVNAQTIPDIPDSWIIIYEDYSEAAKKQCKMRNRISMIILWIISVLIMKIAWLQKCDFAQARKIYCYPTSGQTKQGNLRSSIRNQL